MLRQDKQDELDNLLATQESTFSVFIESCRVDGEIHEEVGDAMANFSHFIMTTAERDNYAGCILCRS